MARHGWHVAEEFMEPSPRWRCARCSEIATRAIEEGGGETPSAPPEHFISVLVVDDEEQVGRATRRILRDFQVVPARSGQEALEILASLRFDVVVSDVSMPGLSGPQLYEQVCQRWPHLARRFVFVSGNPFNAQLELTTVADRAGQEVPPLFDKLTCRHTLPLAVLDAVNRNAERSGTYPITRESPLLARVAG